MSRRIVFICGSLEPGRDGVGDYTRRLAGELIRQGNECRILALNDSHLTETDPLIEEFQTDDGTSVPCLRLSITLSWKKRTELSKQWIEKFNPDWLSLQFVPFGYHPKGLCFGLGIKLVAIFPKASWHIMYHELWLGLSKESSFKHRIWGVLQRKIIRGLIKRLRPKSVHTHAEPYRLALKGVGVDASILPLFGNIPPVVGDGWQGLLEPIASKRMGGKQDRNRLFLVGVFGAVHPEWNLEEAVDAVLTHTQRLEKIIMIVFFGKNNFSLESAPRLEKEVTNRAVVVFLGERSADEISRILHTLDFGLATTPYSLIQKSGTVAAMLEHGLPILVSRDDWHLRMFESPLKIESTMLFSLKEFTRLETLPSRQSKLSDYCGVSYVASRLFTDLRTAS